MNKKKRKAKRKATKGFKEKQRKLNSIRKVFEVQNLYTDNLCRNLLESFKNFSEKFAKNVSKRAIKYRVDIINNC